MPPEVLGHAPAGARLVDTQHLSLDEIVEELRAAHERGEDVARLHSGDLSIYSARGEQTRRLDELGIPWDVTPGVPAFAAAAATLRRELTLPGVAQTVILTRHSRASTPCRRARSWPALAAHGATLVLHLAVQAIDEIVATLDAALRRRLPGGRRRARELARRARPPGTLATIAAAVREAGVRRTAVIVVGPRARGRRVPREPPLLGGARAPVRAVTSRACCSGRHRRGARARGGAHARRRARHLVAGRSRRAARACPRARCAWAASAGPSALARWLVENDIAAVVDATHPFAAADLELGGARPAERAGVPLLRLERPGWSAAGRATTGTGSTTRPQAAAAIAGSRRGASS